MYPIIFEVTYKIFSQHCAEGKENVVGKSTNVG